MTDLQTSKLNMAQILKKIIEEYQSVWKDNVPFSTAFNNFYIPELNIIESNKDSQSINTSGITKEKDLMRASLVEKAAYLANRLQSLSLFTKNNDLFGSVNYRETDLKRLRDNDLLSISTIIFKKATDNEANLVPYSVTAAMVTELETLLKDYNTKITAPRVAVSNTKNATEILKNGFTDLDFATKELLDREIEVYKQSNADFYNRYKTGRIIINKSKSSLSLKGKVKDKALSTLLSGVTVSVASVFSAAKLEASAAIDEKKSTDKGYFQFKSLKPGTYQITARKVGYVDKAITVYVNDGETVNVELGLERV